MTAPLALQVPAPSFAFKPIGGGFAPLEQPVELAFADVRFPDGTPMAAADYVGAQALLTRNAFPAAAPEIWDAGIKSWRAAAGADLFQVAGIPLTPPKSGTSPWQGLLLGAVEQDAAGAPQIAAAIAHFPSYTVRGVFHARRGAATARGIGPESPPLEFASAADHARFGAELAPDQEGATRVRLVLRDGSAQAVGILEIDASSGSPVVTIANRSAGAALASLRLEADGAISLRPLFGRRVTIYGDLETEHVRYLPAAAGVKADL